MPPTIDRRLMRDVLASSRSITLAPEMCLRCYVHTHRVFVSTVPYTHQMFDVYVFRNLDETEAKLLSNSEQSSVNYVDYNATLMRVLCHISIGFIRKHVLL